MVRKAIALAVASMISLSGPALAADAKVSAQKAAAAKADSIQRAGSQQGADQFMGDSDFLLWLAFGVITIAVTAAAMEDDDEATSP